MVDLEIVRSPLASIAEMPSLLRRHEKVPVEDFLTNRELQLAVEHALLIAIQSLLDLATHILADSELRDIADYRDALLKLGQIKVIPLHFAESISEMAGFRNRLVHEYQEIDPKRVHAFLRTRLGDFEEFLRYLRDHFRLT